MVSSDSEHITIPVIYDPYFIFSILFPRADIPHSTKSPLLSLTLEQSTQNKVGFIHCKSVL